MKTFIASGNVTSPLGMTLEENFSKMVSGLSAIRFSSDGKYCKIPAFISVFDEKIPEKFETLCEMSLKDALKNAAISPENPRTLFILSTTKGNIGTPLNITAGNIAAKFKFYNKPMVVSNACISGLIAIILAERMIKNGTYDDVVVTGADILTNFIISGFQCLKAIGTSPCRPFDSQRDGINLGECAATVVLTANRNKCSSSTPVECLNGAFNSDANHISGPSRTAEGLYLSMSRTLNNIGMLPDFINAHGTATLFNDEMEAIGFDRVGLNQVPVNSFKGYIGHTLGAAGVAECVISAMSLEKGIIIGTKGYENHGVTRAVSIAKDNINQELHSCLKTASGFGGCNASVMLVKNDAI